MAYLFEQLYINYKKRPFLGDLVAHFSSLPLTDVKGTYPGDIATRFVSTFEMKEDQIKPGFCQVKTNHSRCLVFNIPMSQTQITYVYHGGNCSRVEIKSITTKKNTCDGKDQPVLKLRGNHTCLSRSTPEFKSRREQPPPPTDGDTYMIFTSCNQPWKLLYLSGWPAVRGSDSAIKRRSLIIEFEFVSENSLIRMKEMFMGNNLKTSGLRFATPPALGSTLGVAHNTEARDLIASDNILWSGWITASTGFLLVFDLRAYEIC
ncbi:uncharacterized protein LOC131997022 [Stomoxys calcitrans]|uniref:uncharacterized protein LOC131997022 n=1 Tax=Stomoxys calcitrans TaxID=35570 RepID=UPI0027E299F0|nr:uncharacterized protein LOC131997022 [Stomoxys calcitrans]